MLDTIVIQFEKVTKFPMVKFLEEFSDFMSNDYPEINRYYSGVTEKIDGRHMKALTAITENCKVVISHFENFSNKFSNCGYWELLELIDNINTKIEKINKLPKFRRTSESMRSYLPVIQTETEVGGYKTMEDVANRVNQINGDNSDWINIMQQNDIEERDWEIDGMKTVNVYLDNRSQVLVTTILDAQVGDKIYGKDLSKHIKFSDNDLKIVKYQENLYQKVNILLELNRGDVPEDMLFGKNIKMFSGVTANQFLFPELANQLRSTFLQNDLFELVEITNYKIVNGDLRVSVNIRTKYKDKISRDIKI